MAYEPSPNRTAETDERCFVRLDVPTDLHPLLVSCIFHYEFEFIHPFADGNGRTSRLWHTLLLSHWRPPLTWIPIESVIRGRRADHYAAIADSNPVGGERFLCHLHAHGYQRCAHPPTHQTLQPRIVRNGRSCSSKLTPVQPLPIWQAVWSAHAEQRSASSPTYAARDA